jgi:two-component system phosphate regulon sensor histidine kinase PhoR
MDNHGNRSEVVEALAGGIGWASRRSETEGREFRYVAVPIRREDELLGVARVAQPTSAFGADRRRIGLSITVAAAAAALVGGVLAVLLAGAVTQPLNRLRRAASALAAGAFDQRVETGGGAEVSELATAFNEMTARLRATVDELAHERSRLEALIAASENAVLALDRAGMVRYINPAAERLFDRAGGRSFFEVARNHELNALVRRALTSDQYDTVSVQLNPGWGARTAPQPSPVGVTSLIQPLETRDRWLEATVSPITGGGDWALLLILQDVTEIRRAEITRRDFVANVSHELRTPLAGIKAVVETLQDGALEDQSAAREFLGRVDAEVDRLVQLVEELLQLARIESGAAPLVLADVSVTDLLAATIDRFRPQAERAGVALTLDVRPAGTVRADADRLGQAVGNLVHNALKFTPPGGQVTVGAARANGVVRITVADTGSGIDPADLPRIFERFYVADRSRSRRGTGLGLAIVKHVVRAHGGSVSVESTLGRGSTFTIELPVGGAGPPAGV